MQKNTLRRTAAVVALALALGACATVDPSNYAATAARVTTTYDPYTGQTSFRAPPVHYQAGLFQTGHYVLRATRLGNESYPESVQIYASLSVMGGWPFFDRASAMGGERLEVTRIDSDVSCSGGGMCIHVEDVGLSLTEDQFRRFSESGLQVQISGRGGFNARLNVPAAYFQAFAATMLAQPASTPAQGAVVTPAQSAVVAAK